MVGRRTSQPLRLDHGRARYRLVRAFRCSDQWVWITVLARSAVPEPVQWYRASWNFTEHLTVVREMGRHVIVICRARLLRLSSARRNAARAATTDRSASVATVGMTSGCGKE